MNRFSTMLKNQASYYRQFSADTKIKITILIPRYDKELLQISFTLNANNLQVHFPIYSPFHECCHLYKFDNIDLTEFEP